MNILFLSIGRLDDLTQKSLYPDLLREIKSHGHNVYAVSLGCSALSGAAAFLTACFILRINPLLFFTENASPR